MTEWNPARSEFGDVDVVDPDRHVRDDPKRWDGVEQRPIDAFSKHRQDAVRSRNECDELVTRGRDLPWPAHDVGIGRKRLEHAFGKSAGDRNLRPRT